MNIYSYYTRHDLWRVPEEEAEDEDGTNFTNNNSDYAGRAAGLEKLSLSLID